jgi:chromosome partitioning protein
MMNIWAVSNQKGGVGKTTTVVTMGGLLCSWGYRTLLVDLDPHGSLTSYFKMNPDEIENSVYNLFQNASKKQKNYDPKSFIVKTEVENLSVLPAATAIATLDKQIAGLEGMGLVISNALAELTEDYDFVIIDTPPMLGVLMINALAACDHLIIPVLAEFLSLKGLDRMLRTIQMVFRSKKNPPGYTILPTMFDKRTKAAQDSLEQIRAEHPEHVWESVIPTDTKLREASREGIPGSFYAPDCRSVEAYTNFLESLIQELSPQVTPGS